MSRPGSPGYTPEAAGPNAAAQDGVPEIPGAALSESEFVSTVRLRELFVELDEAMSKAMEEARHYSECLEFAFVLAQTLENVQRLPERDPVRAAWAFEARRLTEELRMYGGVL